MKKLMYCAILLGAFNAHQAFSADESKNDSLVLDSFRPKSAATLDHVLMAAKAVIGANELVLKGKIKGPAANTLKNRTRAAFLATCNAFAFAQD